MLPLCAAEGVGVIPWSPLARGRLTRPWDAGSARAESDEVGLKLFSVMPEADSRVVAQAIALASARGVPPARIALAWVLQKAEVTAPIIGATRPEHLEDAVAALSLRLTAEEIAALEAPYQPHPVMGFG